MKTVRRLSAAAAGAGVAAGTAAVGVGVGLLAQAEAAASRPERTEGAKRGFIGASVHGQSGIAVLPARMNS